MDLATLVLCFFSGLAFAGVRLLLADRVSAFWVDLLSVLVALLVFASRSILGIDL